MSRCGKKKGLTLLTCIAACVAFIFLCISIGTDFWLYTFERVVQMNGTKVITMHSGLWRKCIINKFMPLITEKSLWSNYMVERPSQGSNCSYIVYLEAKPEGSGDLRPTHAILYDMRPATFFPLSGLLFLMIGCILFFINQCESRTKVFVFVGGGLYVLSGICMLIGIVLYVGSISQAFDSKSGSFKAESRYFFDYGFSFYFLVVAFVLSEFSGIFAIYLYIAQHKHHLRMKRERTALTEETTPSDIDIVEPDNGGFSHSLVESRSEQTFTADANGTSDIIYTSTGQRQKRSQLLESPRRSAFRSGHTNGPDLASDALISTHKAPVYFQPPEPPKQQNHHMIGDEINYHDGPSYYNTYGPDYHHNDTAAHFSSNTTVRQSCGPQYNRIPSHPSSMTASGEIESCIEQGFHHHEADVRSQCSCSYAVNTAAALQSRLIHHQDMAISQIVRSGPPPVYPGPGKSHKITSV